MSNQFLEERAYHAAPEELFSAWTDVAVLSRWFGCGDGMLWRIHQWDAKPGGAIHVSLDFGDHSFEVRGRFEIVDAPHHLRYRWLDDETVDVRIERRGTGSLLRLEHSWPETDDDRSMISAGWTNALLQLATAATSAVAPS